MEDFVRFEKDDHETVQEYVYRVLSYNLLTMRLTPGKRISEADISKCLSVSRTPIRESFIRLARLGLLDIQPQRGTFVAKINNEQVNEFLFLRTTMEEAIMKIACSSFPIDLYRQLEKNLEEQKWAVEQSDYAAFFPLDNAFHGIIFEGCGKHHIWEVIEKTNVNYLRVRALDNNSFTSSADLDVVYQQHLKMLEAIRTKDWNLGYTVLHEFHNKCVSDIEVLRLKYPNYFQ